MRASDTAPELEEALEVEQQEVVVVAMAAGSPEYCMSGTVASQSDMADHHVPHPASPYKPAPGCHRHTLRSSRCIRPSCLHSPQGMPACCRILSGMTRLDTLPLHAKALSSQQTLVSFHPHHRALNIR